MNVSDESNRYLPLSEQTYYILLSLVEPMHGYGIMSRVGELSRGTVQIGPGTLYGALAALEKDGLIVKIREEQRRKIYELTPRGRGVLSAQIRRLLIMANAGLDQQYRL